jgi:hypothetical protein
VNSQPDSPHNNNSFTTPLPADFEMTILPATEPESSDMNEASTRRRFGDDTGASEPLLRGRTNNATKRKGKEWRISMQNYHPLLGVYEYHHWSKN